MGLSATGVYMGTTNCRVLLSLSLFLAVTSPSLIWAWTPDPCKDNHAESAFLTERDAIYTEAQDLGQTLAKLGFQVNCIQGSKESQLFEGQKGAALYRTDQGSFEVWFLPKAANFGALEIVTEPQGNGRYLYTFRGTPHIPAKFNSAKPIWYIRHESLMFEVFGDQVLAQKLSRALQQI